MKVNYNSELEIIDTPEKAYILGLYYSDGFVTYNPLTHSYFSGIGLHSTDREVIEKIQEKLPIFIIAHGTHNTITVKLNKKKACEDLIKNGVLTHKSGINKNSVKFPVIHSSLYSHFIRGYFDGDGSIFFATKYLKRNGKGFCFTSCNYFLIKKIQEILFNERIPMKIRWIRGGQSVIRGKSVKFNTLTFYIESRDISIIKRACKYLYKEATIYMNRKYEIFHKWYEANHKYTICPRCGNNKAILEGISFKRIRCGKCNRFSILTKIYNDKLKPKKCKFCKSERIVANGITYSKINKLPVSQRFLCKNCNKHISIKLGAP